MAKKTPAKKSPKASPASIFGTYSPPEYTINKKVQVILDNPDLDSSKLSMRDRAILVLELGKRLVSEEEANFHDAYSVHAAPLVAAGLKAYKWIYDDLLEAVEDNPLEKGDNWYPALPFILSLEQETVEDATNLICVQHPGDGKDRLSGVGDLLESFLSRSHELSAATGKTRNQIASAISSGITTILFCGDLRLLGKLNAAWDRAPEEVRELVYQVFDVRITELQVEFYLSILERSKPDSDDFERAALHLSHCVQHQFIPFMHDKITIDRVFFNFGLHEKGDDLQVKSQTPVRKYLSKIEPRLNALKPRSPKLITDILTSWQKA